MSLFRKPKKQSSRRVFSSFGDEDNELVTDEKPVKDSDEKNETKNGNEKSRKKDKKLAPASEKTATKSSLLSFNDEEEEGGEVFQVKKSSHSKKVMRMMDKERKKKKSKGGSGGGGSIPDDNELKSGQLDSGSSSSLISKPNTQGKNCSESSTHSVKKDRTESSKQKIQTEIRSSDDFVLVVKKSDSDVVLNGRAALCAGRDDMSSDEDGNDNSDQHHKFAQPDFKFLLESGKIPDAAMIHAARKRRQKARELGDFIPVEEKEEKKPTRRIQDDQDDDNSEEEERIDMNNITGVKEREERREQFYSVQQETDDDSDYELNEWENQQIRKGVTGAQLVSAQQESVLSQFLIPQQSIKHELDEASMSTGALLEQAYARSCMDKPKTMLMSKQKTEKSGGGPKMPQEVLQKLKDRIKSVRELSSKHLEDIERMSVDLKMLKIDGIEAEQQHPIAAGRYRFYQELRGYASDLVDCMDEKLPQIVDLEKRATGVMSKFKSSLIERRRQDIRDQAKEVADLAVKFNAKKPADDEERVRRAAEREGRRTRRRRDRERNNQNESHLDGMSSDDEIPDQEAMQYKKQVEELAEEAEYVFQDATDDFCDLALILRRFTEWKNRDLAAYKDAYVSVCLPKIVGPLIRLRMITWSPLDQNCKDIDKMPWFKDAMLFGHESGDSEQQIRSDPDVRFVPSLVEKIILPKLTEQIENSWDPLSTSQSLRLVGLIGKLGRDYPSLRVSSKATQNLFMAILEKMKSSLDNDIFIPIFAKQVQEAKTSFFQRQFCSGLKLFRNFLSWQGIVSDVRLREIAIASLLNRYLLSAMRVCSPNDAISKAHIIVYTLPRVWLQQDSELLPNMELFITFLKHIASQLDPKNHMESIEKILKILASLHSTL